MRRAQPKVRLVLLDHTFINALLATDVAEHSAALASYGALVERSGAGLDRLFALSPVLGGVPREFRRGALAPVQTMHVSQQHRSAARKVGAASAMTALSLVLMRRERIRTVATASHEFDPFDVEVLSVAISADAISSGTEPTPAPRSTDE